MKFGDGKLIINSSSVSKIFAEVYSSDEIIFRSTNEMDEKLYSTPGHYAEDKIMNLPMVHYDDKTEK